MDPEHVQKVREQAQAILERAESDDAFRQRLRDDPEATLRAEGLPDEAIGEVAYELGVGEVGGYAVGMITIGPLCCLVSCIVTRVRA